MIAARPVGDPGQMPPVYPTIKRFSAYLRPHTGKLVFLLVLMVLYSLMLSALPLLMGYATTIMAAGPGPAAPLDRVIYGIAAIGIILWISGAISQRLLADIAQDALLRLRMDLFSHIHTLSLGFFDRRPIGELMSRVTNDTQVIEQYLSIGFLQTMQSVMTVIITTILMVWISPALTAFTYLVVLGLVGISWLITKVSGPAFVLLQQKTGDINGYCEEWLSGEKTVIASRRQKASSLTFSRLSREVAEAGERAQFSALVSQPVANVFSNLQSILLLVIGGIMAINGRFEIGVLVSFIGFSFNLMGPLSQIFSMYAQILNAIVGSARVFEIMDEKPVVADLPAAPAMPAIRGDVAFDAVDFSYVPGRRVLHANTFHAQPGQVFGLCGPTGAGKSTIINILTRYYEIENGAITVDGQDIRSVRQDTLRVQIAQVLQEPFLFTDTVMANLKYAREGATDGECISAAKQANAHDFIMQQPQGYDTLLTDGGANLSQGQRQMITIARAIVANPRMLILDEATSNVDTRTEKLIQEGLLQLQRGRTSFIIAHRLSTIRHADQILVIDKGEIIERGSHRELMTGKGFYFELYMSQFRGKLAGHVGT
ncbi:MAG: ABC transporter ATP-binding protein [Methanoregula sp.]|nr:MAG: ABC transporter ATP-binding protein [Methanoregula sp.]